MRRVARIDDLPVHVGVLWTTADEARACPRGVMDLWFCETCGLLTNTGFDPALLDYTLEYDNSLDASAIFREFEADLVAELVERYDLHGRTIVEIGSGKGRFLSLLCESGGNSGIGFDPSIGTDVSLAGGAVELRAEYFGPDTRLESFDLLCCRQVLEHIVDLHEFLAPIRSTIKAVPDAVAYFDVPNSYMLLRDQSVWDLIYEHCYYFVNESLDHVMWGTGFDVRRSWESFEGQFASVELGVDGAASDDSAIDGEVTRPAGASPELSKLVDDFGEHLDDRRSEWSARLAHMRSSGMSMAVWGAGARAVSFFAMLDITGEAEFLIDSNPKKQGTFLAGSGHAIHPPEWLSTHPVDVVVLVNGVYREEIGEQVAILNPGADVVVA